MDIHISAEKLRDKLRKLCEKYNVSFGGESKGFGTDLAALPEKLFAADDITEESHGKWICENGVFACPKCGYSFEHEGYTVFFNFCPCCGKVMNENATNPKTNADVIREMTSQQLLDFIRAVEFGDYSSLNYGVTFCDLCERDGGNALNLDCNGCLLHWLNSPATDTFGLLEGGAKASENCADNP